MFFSVGSPAPEFEIDVKLPGIFQNTFTELHSCFIFGWGVFDQIKLV